MAAISLAYHQAAQQVAAFVAAPTPDRQSVAPNILQQARTLMTALEQGRWFQAAKDSPTWANNRRPTEQSGGRGGRATNAELARRRLVGPGCGGAAPQD